MLDSSFLRVISHYTWAISLIIITQTKRGEMEIEYKEKIFYSEDGEALEQITQRHSGSPIRGDTKDQAGPSSEQPDLAVVVL